MSNTQLLNETARALVAPAKGILAADESPRTIKRRFDMVGVESTAEARRNYREMLFRTSGAEDYISGVILHDETISQDAADGTPLVRLLQEREIIPGIKVDAGTTPLAGAPDETITEGLDGLAGRLAEYREMGARFTKWRAVLSIGNEIPSLYCINVNAHALARFAAISQAADLVPIVEPEVIMDGDHSIQRCFEVTVATLHEVFCQLREQRVALDGMLLKPNMVLSGSSASQRVPAEIVARKTVACLKQVVPAAVPGIVFLSGGQTDDEATVNLNAINTLAAEAGAPWELSYSYGRGLQSAPLKVWSGSHLNAAAAQEAYLRRAELASAARQGKYASPSVS